MTLDKKIEKSEDAGEVVGMYFEAVQGVCGTGETGNSFHGGTREKRSNFEGNRGTKTILGNKEHKIFCFDFWRTGEQANLFQGNKGTGTPRRASILPFSYIRKS